VNKLNHLYICDATISCEETRTTVTHAS
jgi:hypothetical protein